MIKPDNFAGDPYQGGLNQLGHVASGAALLWLFLFVAPMTWAIVCAGGLALVLEVYQLKYLEAKGKDYAADVLYWLCGISVWAVMPQHLPPFLMAAFLVEYVRIRWLI